MRSSFENLSSTCDSHTRTQRHRSPSFLTAVKGLVHRASTGSIRSENPQSNADGFHGSASNSSSRRSSDDSFTKQIPWKRRGQTPGMDDYLTLSQLENIWDNQDSYLGFIDVPQKATQYTFQEAVEAPVFTKHRAINQPPEPSPPRTSRNDSVPRIKVYNDPNIIDGLIHPALRPEPYLPDTDSPNVRNRPLPPRLVISVPPSNWI